MREKRSYWWTDEFGIKHRAKGPSRLAYEKNLADNDRLVRELWEYRAKKGIPVFDEHGTYDHVKKRGVLRPLPPVMPCCDQRQAAPYR